MLEAHLSDICNRLGAPTVTQERRHLLTRNLVDAYAGICAMRGVTAGLMARAGFRGPLTDAREAEAIVRRLWQIENEPHLAPLLAPLIREVDHG